MSRRLLFVSILLLACGTAQAAIVEYCDQAAFDAAIAGFPTITEDFSGFAVDTDFRPEPVTVTLAMGTLGQIGVDEAFRNLVDVAPFVFTDNNGTTHASSFVNADKGQGGTDVELVFNCAGVGAYSADYNGVTGGEFLDIDVIATDGVTVLATVSPSNCGPGDTFHGFVGDAGELAGSIIYTAQNENPGGAGKGYGLDNITAVCDQVPVELQSVEIE